MHVSYEKIASMLVLHSDKILYCTKIVSNVKIARASNTANHRFHAAKLMVFGMI